MRLAALVEYDGSQFNGWQIQTHVPSVQEALEKGLSHVANAPIRVHTAGRTDTGVHAIAQVIHFDTDKSRSQYSWLRGTNTQLPKGVAMHHIMPVSDDFHARFSAISRQYRYIINTRKIPLGIYADYVSCYPLDLEIKAMRQATKLLIGQHDFSAYRASGCQSMNPIKTIHSLTITRQDDWIWLDICADGFLQHMVRNIVGVLLKIGADEQAPIWAKQVLQSKDRTQGGITAKPNGLYFVQANYAPEFGLLKTSVAPKFW